MLIVMFDPYMQDDRFDTIPPVEHPNNTIIVLLFICRISRSLCRGDDMSFQSDGLKKIKKVPNRYAD